jgi:hypothetical protein
MSWLRHLVSSIRAISMKRDRNQKALTRSSGQRWRLGSRAKAPFRKHRGGKIVASPPPSPFNPTSETKNTAPINALWRQVPASMELLRRDYTRRHHDPAGLRYGLRAFTYGSANISVNG